MTFKGFIGGIGISRHLCMDIDHDGLCDRCGMKVEQQLDDAVQSHIDRMVESQHRYTSQQSGDDRRTATATKVWKVECPCGTNWVYDEFADSLPDECENCGRQVEIMPGELGMDSYTREDLAAWLDS